MRKKATLRQVIAGTMEYLSVFPTTKMLFELLPLDRWFSPAQQGFAAKLVNRLRQQKSPCLPLFLRRWLGKLNPDYDIHLKAWPRSVADFPPRPHIRQNLLSYLKQKRYLDAYAYFWSTRRPITTKRVFLPLMQLLNIKKRPFLATMTIFFWSGFLHACFTPFLLLYLWLAPRDLALITFLTIWFGFSLFGLPVAWRETRIKKGREVRRA